MVYVPPQHLGCSRMGAASPPVQPRQLWQTLHQILHFSQQLLAGLMQWRDMSVCLGYFLSSSLWPWRVPMVFRRGNSFYAFTLLGILVIMSYLQKSPKHACAVSGFLRAAGSSGTATLPALFSISPTAAGPKPKLGEIHGEAPCLWGLNQPLCKESSGPYLGIAVA